MIVLLILLVVLMEIQNGNFVKIHNYGTCFRVCDSVPLLCEYDFNITLETTMNIHCLNCPFSKDDCLNRGCIPAGGDVRTVTVANNVIPGPPIMVCENDTVIVKVRNLLPTETISIHWHGIHQVGSFFMDGLPQISQLPILPSETFIYNFTAYPAGTHMWHGHSSFQESDGLYGAFVVRRKEWESVSSLYDFDFPEHTITVWHWYDRPTADVLIPVLHRNESVNGYGLLINGKAGLKKFSKNGTFYTTQKENFNVNKGQLARCINDDLNRKLKINSSAAYEFQGYRYRFRLISNSAIYCPLHISVDNHKLKVIASETSFFEPVDVDSLMVGAGDRFDFVLEANAEKSCYMMRFRAIGDCGVSKTSVHEEAFICYDGLSPTSFTSSYNEADRNGTLLNPSEIATYNYSDKTLIHLTDLNCTESESTSLAAEPNVTLYIQIHSRNYEKARFPGAWHQFDNISFLYPGVSFLKNKFESPEICNRETRENYCQDDFCKCTYVQQIPKNSLVEIVLVDITQDRNQDHPVHLHGYKFYVVAMGILGANVTLEDIKIKNDKGFINKDMNNPISKDTVSVPNKGYAVIRFIANNPGFWLLHCHVTNHMDLGMAMILQIGSPEEILNMCHTYQQCGSWYNSKGSYLYLNNLTSIMLYLIIMLNIMFS